MLLERFHLVQLFVVDLFLGNIVVSKQLDFFLVLSLPALQCPPSHRARSLREELLRPDRVHGRVVLCFVVFLHGSIEIDIRVVPRMQEFETLHSVRDELPRGGL